MPDLAKAFWALPAADKRALNVICCLNGKDIGEHWTDRFADRWRVWEVAGLIVVTRPVHYGHDGFEPTETPYNPVYYTAELPAEVSELIGDWAAGWPEEVEEPAEGVKSA